MRKTTCNWIKKILDEATRTGNVFSISWFSYLFLLRSISLFVKCNFILWYEAWVNAIRASSFIENSPQISQNQSLSSEICLGSSHEIGRSLPIVFQRNWPWKFPRNSREIGRFFREIVPENPAKFDFFFRDLPEALFTGFPPNVVKFLTLVKDTIISEVTSKICNLWNSIPVIQLI